MSRDEEIASFERKVHPVKLQGWCGSGEILFSLCHRRCASCRKAGLHGSIMGQHRPEYGVGRIAGEGSQRKERRSTGR